MSWLTLALIGQYFILLLNSLLWTSAILGIPYHWLRAAGINAMIWPERSSYKPIHIFLNIELFWWGRPTSNWNGPNFLFLPLAIDTYINRSAISSPQYFLIGCVRQHQCLSTHGGNTNVIQPMAVTPTSFITRQQRLSTSWQHHLSTMTPDVGELSEIIKKRNMDSLICIVSYRVAQKNVHAKPGKLQTQNFRDS